jgi:hypothetical protein
MVSQNINACGTVNTARERPIPAAMTPTVGVAGAGAGAATSRCNKLSAAGQASTTVFVNKTLLERWCGQKERT